MNRPTNAALKVAGIALALSCLGGALAGCGGSDSDGGSAADTPTSASASESASESASPSDDASGDAADGGFCAKLATLSATVGEADPDDPSAAIKRLKGWVGDMEEIGLPDEMTDEARAGFQLLLATFESADEDASLAEIQKLGTEFSAAQNKKVEAFGTWATENCTPAAPSADAS